MLYGTRLRALSILAAVTLTAGFGLAFFYAPMDADQGFMQKIFYVHVPLAIVALGGFVFGGIMAIQHLRTRDPRYDLRSYVAIHLSLVLGAGVLITGSIWAKASWGHWWVWDEPTLVSFLVVFLLYATYQPLRFSIEDPERQARYASVFAITAGAFVPLNFLAVRLAQAYTHPRVFATTDGGLPAKMQLPFYLCLIGMALLFATLWKYEMASKHTSAQLRSLRRKLGGDDAVAPQGRTAAPTWDERVTDALPDNTGYVAAAYLVFFALVLIYVVIMSAKLSRFERELSELEELADERARGARARNGGHLMELLVLGISHNTAPVALRERLALTERAADALHDRARRARGDRRGGRHLDVQPHRDLPGDRGSRARGGRAAGPARPAGRHPADRARPGRLLAAQLRCGAPALPRRPPAWTR